MRFTAALVGVLVVNAGAVTLRAQTVGVGEVTTVGSESDERQRLSYISDATLNGALPFRSLSLLSPKRHATVTLLLPEARLVTNSALPFSLNDGPMWAGRGVNAIYTAGIDVRVRMFRLVVAPQFTSSENKSFQTIPFPQGNADSRNVWANPFHPATSSIDLPLRFGDAKLKRWDFGQSSLTATAVGIDAGVATENVWWGPGQQNAIMLSNNAPGFAHAFLRTRDGINTKVGRFDAQWLLGRLRESDFFDSDTTNNTRSLSAMLVAYTPSRYRGINIGISRIVVAPETNGAIGAGEMFNVFRDVGHPNTSAKDIAKGAGPDQITALFARIVVPSVNFETYAEWARFEFPRSLRDFMESPGHSQGYTLGLQWARPFARVGTLRLAAEGTYVEPDASVRIRTVATSYTSRSVVQGFTNRGQALGAAIGPGSSSQWMSADLFGARFRVGASLSRIRWDNATLWTPIVPELKNEDVSLIGGLKGSVTWKKTRLALEYAQAARLDYLYQDRNDNYLLGSHKGVDILNRTLSITLTTAVGR